MATFREIPPEILLLIAEFTHPGDLVSFGLVSRKTHNSFQNSLRKHREHIDNFSVVDDHDCLLQMDQIAANPSLSWYIRTYVNEIDCLDQGGDEPPFDIEIEALSNRDMDEGFAYVIWRLLFRTQEDIEEACRSNYDWLAGRQIPRSKVALLRMATNLTTLVICAPVVYRHDDDYYYQNSLLEMLGLLMEENSSREARAKLFPCLKRLRISHEAGRSARTGSVEISSQCLKSLMMLPALEVLSVATSCNEGDDGYIEKASSTVQHLELGPIFIWRDKWLGVRDFIFGAKTLKSFCLEKTDTNVIGYLQRSHGETLERLDLTWNPNMLGCHTLPSLAGMSVLDTLRIGCRILFDELHPGKMGRKRDLSRCISLHDRLPRALQTLCLIDSPVNGRKAHDPVLSTLILLLRNHRSRVPQLKGICIRQLNLEADEDDPRLDLHSLQELKELCQNEGILLSTQYTRNRGTCLVCPAPRLWLPEETAHSACHFHR